MIFSNHPRRPAPLIEHGGSLELACRHYRIPLADWLDLSTGINPHGWPTPAIPPRVMRCLPEQSDGLIQTARDYFNAPFPVAAAGSQPLIQCLAGLYQPARVAVLRGSYAEHPRCWKNHGHQVWNYAQDAEGQGELQRRLAGGQVEALIIVNPDNPGGRLLPPRQLLAWHQQLAAGGGLLVVDEAFMDPSPEYSLAPHSGIPGLVVLRSPGKFFGLAGLRLGFALGDADLAGRLHDQLGPWPVSGPARWLGSRALADRGWQRRCRARLATESARLRQLLARHLPGSSLRSTALFSSVLLTKDQAYSCRDQLGRLGIWVRLIELENGHAWLRFGLPGHHQWPRLEQALGSLQ